MYLSQKLYIRVALAIAFVAISVSLVTAGFAYRYNLNERKAVNARSVKQLVRSAQSTSAIAAYLEDEALAMEIINGLVANDLVSAAAIFNRDSFSIRLGEMTESKEPISVVLEHPFSGSTPVGSLMVYPNDNLIEQQARAAALQNAAALILLSFIVAIAVSVFVHRRLTKPIQGLTDGFRTVDPNVPSTMKQIDIGYRKRDEINTLVSGINALMIALKQNLQTERILRERTQQLEQRFRLIFEQASAGIGLLNENNHVVTHNPAFKNLFETVDEQTNFCELFVDTVWVEQELNQLRATDRVNQVNLDLCYENNGQRRWVHCLLAKVTEQRTIRRKAQESLIEVIMHDVTDRIIKEQNTRFEADHDSLTQLLNRRAGELKLNALLANALENDTHFVLMMVDLDEFKPVNDNYGHDVGDEVLISISQRLKRHFNVKQDICVRWGGDEFVVGFVQQSYDESAIATLAEELLDELRTPIAVSPTITCHIGGSIGIVVAPAMGRTLDELITLADSTMYDVKNAGRNHFVIANAK